MINIKSEQQVYYSIHNPDLNFDHTIL